VESEEVKVSGGEKQRLSIARALLRQPDLLVFDEATSSLDSLTEEKVSETIREISAGEDLITILIAHRLSTVMHADRILVLERGQVVETGTHDELVREKGLYYAMWKQQVGEQEETGTGEIMDLCEETELVCCVDFDLSLCRLAAKSGKSSMGRPRLICGTDRGTQIGWRQRS
jgi:ABC-type multidrug transport system ATPase subunit